MKATWNNLFAAEIILAILLVPLAVYSARHGRWFWFVLNQANITFLIYMMFQNREFARKYGGKI